MFTQKELLTEIWNRNFLFFNNFRENILISNDEIIKICDFGSSKIIDPQGKNTPYIVSRYYRAPELIMCITKYTAAIDIWGNGISINF